MSNSDPSEWRLIDTDLVTVLGILPASESHLYLVLNEPGSGELKIPLGSALAGSVESGQFAQCSYRGAVRGGFFVENISKGQADAAEGGGQWVSISGRGALSLLEDAIIWDDGTTASTRDYAGMTKAAILIALIDEAQARGALANLSYDFTAVLDSDGVAWTDSENYKLNVGSSLLDVTRQFARTGIDFDILPGTGDFVLSAYKLGKGSDKSETVYLRTGVNCEEVTSDEHGDKIKNAQLIAYKDGYISVSDAVSIAARRRREKLLDLKMAQTAASATTIGAAEVALRKDPQKSISVKIYDGAGPRGFVDYELGDYIMLDVQGTETRYRIYGVQPDWKGDQFSTVIVELNSILYENDIQLAQDVAWLLDQWSTANDAGLLAVSYWAAIGDASITYNVQPRGVAIIGDYLYVLNSGTSILKYGLKNGLWSTVVLGSLPNCLVAVGTNLYIGGLLQVSKYDTTTGITTTVAVADTGSPLSANVSALAVNGTTLYASGQFTSINGVAAVNSAKCDTTTGTWSAMADAASHSGSARTMLYSNGLLYSVPLAAAAQVQAWNGTTWSNVGSAFTAGVFCFAEYGTDLLAGSGDAGGIFIWDGATWSVFGGGVNGAVRAIGVYLTDVYIGGSFTDAGNYVSRYSGGTWWQLESGVNALIDSLILNGQDLYVAGDFTDASGKPAQGIAAYFNNFESLADYLENASSSFNMGAAIHAATASAITDTDEVPFWEATVNDLRKITWANIKATLKTYFDTLYLLLTGNGATTQLLQWTATRTAKWITMSGDATIADGGAVSVNKTRLNVRNETGATIATTKAVYTSGFNNFPLILLADNTDEAKHNVIGVTVGSIANAANGYIATGGQCDAETNGWVIGTELYLSTAGALTSTEPTSGSVQHVGIVTVQANYPTGKLLIYTQPEGNIMAVGAGQNAIIRMGDSIGATKLSIRDFINAERYSFDTYNVFEINGPNWYTGATRTNSIHVTTETGGASSHVLLGHSYQNGTGDFLGVPSLGGDRAGGSRATPTAILNDMGLSRFVGGGYDGTTLSGTRAQMVLRSAGNWSATSHPTAIDFWTTPSGSTSRALAYTINSDGTVNIASGKTYNVNGSPHTHDINTVTASSDPGVAASLLKTNASGQLKLSGLGIGITPRTQLELAGGIYFSSANSNTLGAQYDYTGDDGSFGVNYNGYQDGATKYRDFYVADGRHGFVAFFDGSTKRTGFGGNTSPAYTIDTTGDVNVTGDVRKNGTAYTNPDYVLELWSTGKIEKHKDNEGAKNYRRLSLPEVESFIKKNHKLPGFEKVDGLFSGGDALLEKVEELYTHIIELEKRIVELEKK